MFGEIMDLSLTMRADQKETLSNGVAQPHKSVAL
jgi:hypothetical protein